MEHLHPEENKGNERGHHESKVDHAVYIRGVGSNLEKVKSINNLLVASANHLCCAFCETPDSSDCSEAATEPHGYSAPTPIPTRKLHSDRYQVDVP